MTSFAKSIILLLLFIVFGSNCFATILSESDIKTLASEVEKRSKGQFNCHSEGRTLVFETFILDNSYLKGLTNDNIVNSLEDDLVLLCATNFINVRYDIHYIDNAGNERKKKVYLGLSDFLNYNSDTRERISLEDHPKAKGVNLSLVKPRGWTNKEGDGPHIVKKFEAAQGNNYITYMVHMTSLPTFVSKREAQEVFDSYSEDKNELGQVINDWFSKLPNVKILSERTELVGRYPAKRVEYTYAPTAQGMTFKVYAVAWMIFYEDTLIALVGSAMSDNKDEMQQYGTLFDMITGSVRFFDQYTDQDYE
jgi:hypothetical protein